MIATVHIVDDDVDVRESLKWLLESIDLNVKTYEDAVVFLEEISQEEEGIGCVILDVRMPRMSGINAHKKMLENKINLPIIMISAHGSIDMAVSAMVTGAKIFLEKPFDDQVLIEQVQSALNESQQEYAKKQDRLKLIERYSGLTKREIQIFQHVVQGFSNQEIADELKISRKTVEGHRANMIHKMKAGSLADLIHFSVVLEDA